MTRRLLMGSLLLAGCATVPSAPKSQLTLTWLSVGGWLIEDGQHAVLIDPYFSRPADPFASGVVSDLNAIERYAPKKADVILVGHAHVDHALDAPVLAKRLHAPLVGSKALGGNITVTGGEALTFADGAISVKVVPSRHSLIGEGQDTETFAYLVTMSGTQVLVFDTANFNEEAITGLRPDLAILATGLREKVPDYACRLMKALGAPKTIFTTHFDAWRSPVGTPLEQDTVDDLAQFTKEIHQCAAKSKVIVPELFVGLR